MVCVHVSPCTGRSVGVVQSLPFPFSCSKIILMAGVVRLPGNMVASRLMESPSTPLPGDDGRAVPVAKCSEWGSRIMSDPLRRSQRRPPEEVMSTLGSEGGVS